jgi:4-amino-4-deoxy-L-arabinose transferase-like glycosyltransferase
MGRAYIDVATIFYTAIGFSAFTQWKKSEQRSFLILAGLSAGLAFGTKYTGVVIGIGLAVLILIAKPRKGIRNLIAFGLPALVVSVPWVIKYIILVGIASEHTGIANQVPGCFTQSLGSYWPRHSS